MPATVRSGTINLLNTLIGAGILAMPYGLRCNGLVLGAFLIVFSALTSAFGLYLQNKVAKYAHPPVSYFSLCQMTYPQLAVIFDAAIAIKCFGVGVSYLVVIGDLMPKILDSLGLGAWAHERNLWITVFLVLLVAPLSYLRLLASLRYLGLVALFSVLYLVCLVVEHWAVDAAPDRVVSWQPVSWRQTLASFPVFVFAYTCHQNMFSIVNELSEKPANSRTRQANHVIRNGIATACLAYLVVGILGYLTFGNAVDANIITMYPRDSVALLVGRLCIVVMVSMAFPLQCHPCRGSVNHILHMFSEDAPDALGADTALLGEDDALDNGIESENGAEDGPATENRIESGAAGAASTNRTAPVPVPLPPVRFYAITTAIVVASYLVAISVTSLAHVLAFVGSTGSTSISFILPGLFGFMLVRSDSMTRKERFCKYGGLVLSIWGVVVMVVCLGATIFLGAAH